MNVLCALETTIAVLSFHVDSEIFDNKHSLTINANVLFVVCKTHGRRFVKSVCAINSEHRIAQLAGRTEEIQRIP